MEYLPYKYWLSAFLLGLFQSFVANGQSMVYIERIPAPEIRLQLRNKLLHSMYGTFVQNNIVEMG